MLLRSRQHAASLCVLGLALSLSVVVLPQSKKEASHWVQSPQSKLPWYVTTAAIHRVTLKPTTRFWKFEHLSLKAEEEASQLLAWKSEGIDAIEVFAPEEGGNSYDGLDAKNRFRLDPGLGSMDDFHRLVRQVHAMHMSIVTFQNLGYAAIDAPQFIKAEDDMRTGRNTPESRFFYWTDRPDAPPPAAGDSYFFIRPLSPGYDPRKTEFWQWSGPAAHYYWTRWPGKGPDGETTHLPQYNWASSAWPQEASRVVDFWMNTGLDGMIVDAVNWYVGYDWKKNVALIETIRRHPGAKLMAPEGGGAFHTDDPTGWIRDGGWTLSMTMGLIFGGMSKAGQCCKASTPEIHPCSRRRFETTMIASSLPAEY